MVAGTTDCACLRYRGLVVTIFKEYTNDFFAEERIHLNYKMPSELGQVAIDNPTRYKLSEICAIVVNYY